VAPSVALFSKLATKPTKPIIINYVNKYVIVLQIYSKVLVLLVS
jgi:hypothetical protein